jgi:hypothetical protein
LTQLSAAWTPPFSNLPCMCLISTFALNYLTSHISPCSRILLSSMEKNPSWNVVSPQLVESFLHFMELKGSLPRTQEPTTFPYSKPNELFPIVSLSNRSNIILPSTACSSKHRCIWFSRQNRVCTSLHTFHPHLSLLDFTAAVYGAEYKTWSVICLIFVFPSIVVPNNTYFIW